VLPIPRKFPKVPFATTFGSKSTFTENRNTESREGLGGNSMQEEDGTNDSISASVDAELTPCFRGLVMSEQETPGIADNAKPQGESKPYPARKKARVWCSQ
jgi:hypothetical protein